MVHRVEAYFGIEIDLYIYMPGCSNKGKQARRREKAKENAFNQISFVVSEKKEKGNGILYHWKHALYTFNLLSRGEFPNN